MTGSRSSIRCFIAASNAKLRAELRRIAQVCAIDAGLAIPLETLEVAQPLPKDPTIRLRIPLEHALSNEAIWSLACRIASFCPQARVCTQIGDDRNSAEEPSP